MKKKIIIAIALLLIGVVACIGTKKFLGDK